MLDYLDGDILSMILLDLVQSSDDGISKAKRVLSTCNTLRNIENIHKNNTYALLRSTLKSKSRKMQERELIGRLDPRARFWIDPTYSFDRRIQCPKFAPEALYVMHLEWARLQTFCM